MLNICMTTNYKSKLEQTFAKTHQLEYEPNTFSYTIAHKYTPDFKVTDNCYIETKGRFLGCERTKTLAVMKQNLNLQIVMVFQNPNNKLSKKSTTTYASWCEKHNIIWFAASNSAAIKNFVNMKQKEASNKQ